jgi:AcrR family transcriptional regulator
MVTSETPPRGRDATRTRELLVVAARSRFAASGYPATTVRDVAEDAGVNVALISRYFGSKEGLFQACLGGADEDLTEMTHRVTSLDDLVTAICERSSEDGRDEVLLLLLRSSGDPAAEQVRLGVLRRFSERVAVLAERHDDKAALLLRAQILLALSAGLSLMRSTPEFDPLASASAAELAAPVRDAALALLGSSA